MKEANDQSQDYIKALQFEAVHFFDPKAQREIIILYSLGADGVIREFTNGKWAAFPILDQPAEVKA